MANTKKALYSACLVFLGAGAAYADAPKSLHMRKVRVAQPTTPDTPPPDSGGPSAGTPTDTSPPTPAPVSTPAPAPGPADQPPAAPGMTDEELAKAAAAEAEKTQGEEVITVTGSLVERKELTTPSPISVVDKQKLAAAGIQNVGAILQKIPSQGNALNAQNNNGGDGSVRINMRSLGSNRTLTLLNGRRVVPSGLGADDSVDLGTIPLAMIDRVEVLKDGASAIYGSDAIAGVVNIITRTDYESAQPVVSISREDIERSGQTDINEILRHLNVAGNNTVTPAIASEP